MFDATDASLDDFVRFFARQAGTVWEKILVFRMEETSLGGMSSQNIETSLHVSSIMIL